MRVGQMNRRFQQTEIANLGTEMVLGVEGCGSFCRIVDALRWRGWGGVAKTEGCLSLVCCFFLGKLMEKRIVDLQAIRTLGFLCFLLRRKVLFNFCFSETRVWRFRCQRSTMDLCLIAIQSVTEEVYHELYHEDLLHFKKYRNTFYGIILYVY